MRQRRHGLGTRTRRLDAANRSRRNPANGVDRQRRTVSAQSALRIGLVSEVVAADELWTRANEIATMTLPYPTSATQGTVRAIWESLDKPYRAALDQGLIYTRLGNPIAAELAKRGPVGPRLQKFADDPPAEPADRRRSGSAARHPAVWSTSGAGRRGARSAACRAGSLRSPASNHHRSDSCCATPGPRRHLPRRAAVRGDAGGDQPGSRRRPHQKRHRTARLPMVVGAPDDLAMRSAPPATTTVSVPDLSRGGERLAAGQDPANDRPGVAVRMLTRGPPAHPNGSI